MNLVAETANSITVNGQAADPTLAAAVVAMAGTLVLLSVAVWVLLIIAYWKMFTKAGEKGWKSIIPIYNIYVAFNLCWKDGTKNFLIYLLTGIVASIASSSMTVNGSTVDLSSNPVAGTIAGIAAIVCLVWYVRFLIRQAKAYNKGTGCAVLALFFPNIMTLYYGFASTATYEGPQD